MFARTGRPIAEAGGYRVTARTRSITALVALAVLVVTLAPAVPAGAQFGPLTLDVSPETTTTTFGTAIALTARLGRGFPFRGSVNVDFEHFFAGEVDLTAPDLSCTIPTSATSCAVAMQSPADVGFASTFVVAWIDADGSNATCEADWSTCTGGTSEDSDDVPPGTQPEPDGTDVVVVSWVRAPQPPVFSTESPCGDVVRATVLAPPTEIGFSASDANAQQRVVLDATGEPPYASFTATTGNPATGTLTVEPGLLDWLAFVLTGGVAVTVTATDDGNPQQSTACGVELEIGLV